MVSKDTMSGVSPPIAGNAAERRVGVAVHQARDGAQPPTVELDDLALDRREVAHPSDGLDRVAGTEDKRVFEHVDLVERRSAQRGVSSGGRRELRQIADEEALRHASSGTRGIRSSPSPAAVSASG